MPGPLHLDGHELADGRQAWARTSGVAVELTSADDVDALLDLDPRWDHVVLELPADSDPVTIRLGFEEIDTFCRLVGRHLPHAGVPVLGVGWATYADERTARGLVTAVPDRRDAFLLALATLGPDAVMRMGGAERALRGLCGPDATKPLGRAIARAVDEGRWELLHLVSAASDHVPPERLVELLQADADLATDGLDGPGRVLACGSARGLSDQLGELLAPYTSRRRADLLRDLVREVAHHRRQRVDAARRAEVGARMTNPVGIQQDDLRQQLVLLLDDVAGTEPARELGARTWIVGAAAVAGLWEPTPAWAAALLSIVTREVFAARILLAAAEGLRARPEDEWQGVMDAWEDLAPARAHLARRPSSARRRSTRVPSTDGPATQSVIDLDLAVGMWKGTARKRQFLAGRQVRTADAPSVGLALLSRAVSLVNAAGAAVNDLLLAIARSGVHLTLDDFAADPFLDLTWLGLLSDGPQAPVPGSWSSRADLRGADGRPLVATALARRLAADPTASEHWLDLRWHAAADAHGLDLAGQRVANVRVVRGLLVETRAMEGDGDDDPTRPPLDSIPGAVAGAVQLLRLGGRVPPRPVSWSKLVDGLHGSFDTAQLMARTFRVPPRLLQVADGAEIAALGLRVRVGTNIRMLADWANYMGNCILSNYAADAARGRSVLLGLYDDDRLVYNLELVRRRNQWQAWEFQGRFNEEPADAVVAEVHAWVATLDPPTGRAELRVKAHRAPPRRGGGGRSRGRRTALREPGLRALEAVTSDVVMSVAHPVAVLAPLVPSRRRASTDPTPGVSTAFGAPGSDLAATVELVAELSRTPATLAAIVFDCLHHEPRGDVVDALWSIVRADPFAQAASVMTDRQREHLPELDHLASADPTLRRSDLRLVAVPAVRAAWDLGRLRRAALMALADLADADASTTTTTASGTAAPVASAQDPTLLTTAVLLYSAARLERAGQIGRLRPRTSDTRVPVDPAGIVAGHPTTRLRADGGPWTTAWALAEAARPTTTSDLAHAVDRRLDSDVAPILLVPSAALAGRTWEQHWAALHRPRRR